MFLHDTPKPSPTYNFIFNIKVSLRTKYLEINNLLNKFLRLNFPCSQNINSISLISKPASVTIFNNVYGVNQNLWSVLIISLPLKAFMKLLILNALGTLSIISLTLCFNLSFIVAKKITGFPICSITSGMSK